MAVILDGAMGTALMAQGLPPDGLPESWLFERPTAIAEVHAAHAAAGARILLTSTFNLASSRLLANGVERSIEELARRAIELARASGPSIRVAGAIGPATTADAASARDAYERPFRALVHAGADLLWTESHWSLDEARAALAAARGLGVPVVVTLTPRGDEGSGHSRVGWRNAVESLSVLAEDGAAAVGFNCSLRGDPIAGALSEAASRLDLPLVAKPSAGLPGRIETPDSFAWWLGDLSRAGATWLGGCCGTDASHLASAARMLRSGRES